MGKQKLQTRYNIDGHKIKVTRDTITVEGYAPWIAVTYMDEQWQRAECVAWVLSLIRDGIRKPVKENSNGQA